MKVFIGADHRGFELKEKLKVWLSEEGHSIEDVGAEKHNETDDASDYASKVARRVLENPDSYLGIVICGSGAAVDITANRFKGIRCGLGFEASQVEHMKGWDHINMLALPADQLGFDQAKDLAEMFINTEKKLEDRMIRRIKKLDELGN